MMMWILIASKSQVLSLTLCSAAPAGTAGAAARPPAWALTPALLPSCRAAGVVKVVGIDESHRLGTPTIRESLRHFGWPVVFLAGATPQRADQAHWCIPREVVYYRPKRWFELHTYIKTTSLCTFSYTSLELRIKDTSGDIIDDVFNKVGRPGRSRVR